MTDIELINKRKGFGVSVDLKLFLRPEIFLSHIDQIIIFSINLRSFFILLKKVI